MTAIRVRPAVRLAGLAAAIGVLAACSSVRTVDSWRDPAWRPRSVEKVVIVATLRDGVARRTLEDRLAADLIATGVQFTPSYHLFPDKLPEEEALRRRLERAGFDAALLVTVTGRETRVTRGPATAVAVGVRPTFWGRYRTSWGVVMRPGPRIRERIATLDAALFALGRDGAMVWGATFEAPASGGQSGVADDLGRAIAKRIVADGAL